MIRRMIKSNRMKHQKNIFKLSKSKAELNESIVENKNQNKNQNKKSEYICSNR